MDFEPIIQEWIAQGRSEEQIYGVRNFLTGIGGARINELLEPKKPDKRNPEIQALWEYGLEIGFTETKQNLQRFAIKRLLAKHKADKLEAAAAYAVSIKSDRYAPQVNSWLDFEDKYLKLRDYVARQQQTKTTNLDVI